MNHGKYCETDEHRASLQSTREELSNATHAFLAREIIRKPRSGKISQGGLEEELKRLESGLAVP